MQLNQKNEEIKILWSVIEQMRSQGQQSEPPLESKDLAVHEGPMRASGGYHIVNGSAGNQSSIMGINAYSAHFGESSGGQL